MYLSMSSQPQIANAVAAPPIAATRAAGPVAALAFPVKLNAPSFPLNPPIDGSAGSQQNTTQVKTSYVATVKYVNTAYNMYSDAYNNNSIQYKISSDPEERATFVNSANALAITFNQNSAHSLEQYNLLAMPNGYLPLKLYGTYQVEAVPLASVVIAKAVVQAAPPTGMGAPISFNYPTAAPVSDPVMAPVSAPAMAPVGALASAPIGAPVMAPVGAPASAPTGAPVMAPVGAPASAPIGAPVMAPVGAPASAPIGAPIVAPVAAPAMAPTAAPAKAPTAAPVAPPVAPPSTIACYCPFDSNVIDSTGNYAFNANGTVKYNPAIIGNGAYFANEANYPTTNSTATSNRSSNFLTLSTTYDVSRLMSVSGWVQFTMLPNPGQYSTVWEFGSGSTEYLQLLAYTDPTTKACTLYPNAGAAGNVANGTAITVNTWYHFAVAFVPSQSLVLYVNGVACPSVTTGVGAGAAGATFRIADNATTSFVGSGYRPFAGIIDEFRIHNVALTAAAVTTLFNQYVQTGTITYTGFSSGVNLLNDFKAAYPNWNTVAPVNLTVNLSKNCYSTDANVPAMTTGTFPTGSTITLNVAKDAYITGAGGAGGAGGGYTTNMIGYCIFDIANPPQSGKPGGDAISLGTNINLNNTGIISGGGAGGSGKNYVALNNWSCMKGNWGCAGAGGSSINNENCNTQSNYDYFRGNLNSGGAIGTSGSAIKANNYTVTYINKGTLNGTAP